MLVPEQLYYIISNDQGIEIVTKNGELRQVNTAIHSVKPAKCPDYRGYSYTLLMYSLYSIV